MLLSREIKSKKMLHLDYNIGKIRSRSIQIAFDEAI